MWIGAKMIIIKIEDITLKYDDKEDGMDLLKVLVQYDGDIMRNDYMYRAHYNRLVHQAEMMKEYNIPEHEFDILEELFRNDFEADHFYDNEE